jgi:hypothetical protein
MHLSKQLQPGIQLGNSVASDIGVDRQLFIAWLTHLGIDRHIETNLDSDGIFARFSMRKEERMRLFQEYDILQLCRVFKLDPNKRKADLEKEILLSMLSGPVTFKFPNYKELLASVRIRCNIVEAARNTALAFHTSKIERPSDCWTYTEEKGFTVLPGNSLTDALRKATQPEVTGERYAFSCYRATEYVILLGIAQELSEGNPQLLQQLQEQWEARAIKSREFHEIFLQEIGSMEEPLPNKYYVPGDRLWFRNPDRVSGEVTGYEGSWVIYLGNGLFTNFWERDKPYTLTTKCVEIYHWRHGVYKDEGGAYQMDESIVEERVSATMKNPAEIQRILELMMRLRDPLEVNAEGGCIDASREYPRWVCAGSSDLNLPDKR